MGMVLVPILLKIFLQDLTKRRISGMSSIVPLISIMTVIVVVKKVITMGTRGVMDYKILILKMITVRGFYNVVLKFLTTGVFRIRCSEAATVTVRMNVRGDNLTISLTTTGFTTGPLTALPNTVFDM